MNYHSEIIDNYQSLLEIAYDWDDLYTKCEADNIFLSSTWINSWSRYINTSRKTELFIITVRDENNKLTGIAPLGISDQYRMHLRTRVLSFIADEPSDYQDFLIIQDHRMIINEIMKTIMLNYKRWDIIELKEFPNDSNNIKYIMSDRRFHFRKRNCSICPRIEFNEDNRKIESLISKNNKQDILYQMRRLSKNGLLTLKNITREDEVLPFMNSFYKLHMKRWDTTKTKSLFYDENIRVFFNSLAVKIFQKGMAAYSYLEYNGKVVASQMCFINRKTLYYWFCTHDPEYRKYSIGKVSIYFLLKYEIINNLKYFDFLRGHEDYKLHWGAIEHRNIQLTLIKNNLRGMITLLHLFHENNRKLFFFRIYRKIKRMFT